MKKRYLKNFFINKVKNKDVLLVGSASNFIGDVEPSNSKILVCVNGSLLAIKGNLIPDISFFNTSVLGTKNAGWETSSYLNRISTKHLVVIEGHPKFSEEWTKILDEINFESFDFYSFERRVDLLKKLFLIKNVSNSDVLSTSFFSLLLLLQSGVSSVELKGFSLVDGHSYLDNVYERHHKQADRRLLELIKGKFNISGEIMTEKSPPIILGSTSKI